MAYPSVADIETTAHQLVIDPKVVFGFAAINQSLLYSTVAATSFQNQQLGVWGGWIASGKLDKSVTADTMWAFVNQYGNWPNNPAQVQQWAMAAGILNSQGIQVSTPAAGAYYPPANWGSLPQPPNPTGSPGGSGLFDFAGFFARLQADPLGALTTYPGAAAVSAILAMGLLRRFGIRL